MMMNRMQQIAKTVTALVFVLALAGCTSMSEPPTIQSGPDAEVSFDGLNKVNNSKADLAWARSDIDLSGYSKIQLADISFEYRTVKNRRRSSLSRAGDGVYFIDDRAREKFEALAAEVFLEEMQEIRNFTIVDKPGPDVLQIRGALLDVVSYVPPDPVGGRSSVYLRSYGEATLVLELRDSETNTILARSIDRRAAEQMGAVREANTVTTTAEVRRLIRIWAERLRDGLDGFTS